MAMFDLLSSVVASSARAWRGAAAFSGAKTKQPEQMLVLYDIEACPYCRLVREVLSELDLDALIYPCPVGGMRFRPDALDISGVSQFPLLLDLNTGDQLLESADIIDHLYKHYGNASRSASRGLRRQLAVSTSMAATAARSVGGVRGMNATPSISAQQPLELFSFEASPYSRPVRELLTELEIPYRLRNFAKSRWQEMGPPVVRSRWFPDAPITSPNRLRMRELTGRSQVPYLIDPNTGVSMFESVDIMVYLKDTYGSK
ncbi:glutathione S-transferase N-terminal domain-containing protein [Zhongshania aliphaticivorans]|uniref:glutathione S-transferase N-terminal domain-containing protein n=1 Tax=Zhongshania aliphaticivorans TaxID=1470434 RepID=UPI00190FB042|nr:glutathione S-transferase N-terminal domain-containing protein [Zhongshania aliphaticivorans]